MSVRSVWHRDWIYGGMVQSMRETASDRYDQTRAPVGWVWPLLATILLQVSLAFLTRVIPTLAPVLVAAGHVKDVTIGHLAAITTIGSMLFLAAGMPVILRNGPVRAQQIGGILAVFGVLLIYMPNWASLALASLLIGVGYGPTAPAGSEILHKHAPARHRTMIFSIKQAGVPLGGALAGFVLPFFVAIDWRLAVLVSAGLALVCILAVQSLRHRVDVDRDPAQSVSFARLSSVANFTAPMRALGAIQGLRPLVYAGACFSTAQGAWFAYLILYLVAELNFGLATSGALFAVVQLSGVFGRVFLGWLADRLGSRMLILRMLAIASAATTALIALTTPEWPFAAIWVICAIAGISVSSWNGVFIAEVASIVPERRIGEATAGATLFVFVGYVAGPLGFALILGGTASYQLAYFVIALLTLSALAVLARR